jgi:hypothetical protein
MRILLRDFLLSYCPAEIRRDWRPESTLTVLRAATWSGLAQFGLAGMLLALRWKPYLFMRAQQLGPHLAGSSEAVQAGVAVIITLEYLIHPLSFFLLYLAVEGLTRFMGGLAATVVVPNLLLSLYFRSVSSISRIRARRQAATQPADTLDHLPDGVIRIASFQAKDGWNASMTIGIGGQWLEVEREEHGPSPRPFVYILRPASPGKILRGFREYDATAAVTRSSAKEPA